MTTVELLVILKFW